MGRSESKRARAGLDGGNAATILSAVTLLSASLGMNPALAADTPGSPTAQGSSQVKVGSRQVKVGSNQGKVESNQVKVGSSQVKVGSSQGKVESRHVKVETTHSPD